MPDLHVSAEHDGSVGTADIRAALTDLDVSVSSPVDAAGRQLGVYTETADGSHHVHVTNDGHDGSWTLKSQKAVVSAIEAIDGVTGDVTVTEGGYEKSE